MTKKKLQEAVAKYSDTAKETSADEMRELLIIDGASEKDADAIIKELYNAAGDDEEAVEQPTHFEEWQVAIKQTKEGPQHEKLRVLRKTVKITEEEAATLNNGVLLGGNNFAKMYFKPGE